MEQSCDIGKRPDFRDGTIQTEIEELPQHLMSLSDERTQDSLETLYSTPISGQASLSRDDFRW
ncbi:hypothetical protein J6590_083743 [Homalodisca vitripennis]|nr:hypothetical protein J6590_083743 [Homalodisca vitripennis]